MPAKKSANYHAFAVLVVLHSMGSLKKYQKLVYNRCDNTPESQNTEGFQKYSADNIANVDNDGNVINVPRFLICL